MKTKFNPDIHHRRSIRLKEYDYSQAGLYFITICVKDKLLLFGNVSNGKMILNDAGQMIEKWYYEIENKYPDIKCHEKTVMPNHFHCIVENVGADLRVCPNTDLRVCPNTDLRVCPNTDLRVCPNTDLRVCPNADLCVCPNADLCVCPIDGQPKIKGQSHRIAPTDGTISGEPISEYINSDEIISGDTNLDDTNSNKPISGEHIGSPLHRVVQWFKTMTTNEYIRGVKNNGWEPFNWKLWQRNYYEHIIRNEKTYFKIAEYIINNPLEWQDDKYYAQNNRI